MNDIKINLFDLLSLVYKKLWALILAFVVAAVGAYGYCNFFAEPRYETTSSILATNGAITKDTDTTYKSNTVASTDVAASLALVDTVVDLLKTSDIYKQVSSDCGRNYNYSQIKSMTSVSRRSDNTFIVDIKINCGDPDDAIVIANAFSKRSCEYVKKFIPHSHVEVSQSAEKSSQVAPRTLMTTAIVGVAAAIVLFFILLIFETMNHAIKSQEELTQKYKISSLGQIPDFEAAESEVAKYKNYRSKGYRSYRSYRAYRSYNSYNSYGKGYGYGYGSNYANIPHEIKEKGKEDGKNGK